MHDPRAAYLESQVLTATPQKLRLMLIEGALRFMHRAEAAYSSEDPDYQVISESLSRARNIVAELLSSIQTDESDANHQVASVYLFVFQQLTEAQLRRERDQLAQIIEILEIERETWRQVCERYPTAPDAEQVRQALPTEVLASGAAIPPQPQSPAQPESSKTGPSGGFSIEA